MSKRAKTTLKLLFGVALLAALVWLVDWRKSLSILAGVSLVWIAVLLLISLVLVVVSCIKWRMFLAARGVSVSFWKLTDLYLIGYFFNNFAPSNVGGDLARSYILGSHIGSQSNSFGTVFLERFTGFVALIAMALTAACVRPELLVNRSLALLLAAMAAGLGGMLVLIVSRTAQAWVRKALRRLPRKRPVEKLERFVEVVFFFQAHRPIMIKALLLSVLFHVFTIINTQAACLALGVSVNTLDLAVVVPVVLLISAVPVSMNALGIMEGAFVFFLGMAGVEAAAALSVALVFRAKNLIMALFGGLLWLRWNWRAARVVLVLCALMLPVGCSCRQPEEHVSRETFATADGLTLVGDLHLPRRHNGIGLVFLHGSSPQGRRLYLYTQLCADLCARGYAVFSVDVRGYGESAKPPQLDRLESYDFVGDAVSALAHARSRVPADAVPDWFFAGHSKGGGIAVHAALRAPDVRGVVSISPGRRIRERFFAPDGRGQIDYLERRKSDDMGLPSRIPRDLLEPILSSYDIGTLAGTTLPMPVLLIEGAREPAGDLAFSREWVASLGGRVQHCVLSGADHYFGTSVVEADGTKQWRTTRPEVLATLLDTIDTWLRAFREEEE